MHRGKPKLKIVWEEVADRSVKERLFAAFEMLLSGGRSEKPFERNIDKAPIERNHIDEPQKG